MNSSEDVRLFESFRRVQNSLHHEFGINVLYKEHDFLVLSDQESIVNLVIRTLQHVKTKIDCLGILNDQEDLEDMSTKDLQYLLIDAYLAHSLLRTPYETKTRLKVLESVKTHCLNFLELCRSKGLLIHEDKVLMQSYLQQQSLQEDPLVRRERKIRHHLRQKELKEIIETSTFSKLDYLDEEEEGHRDMILKHCQLQVLEIWDMLDSLTSEMNLLKYRNEKENSQKMQETRSSVTTPKTFYPLTLLPNGSTTTLNEKLRHKVFTPGHHLPTMTIDDYLQKQRQKGFILPSTNETKQSLKMKVDPKEGDEDLELYKTRQWDDYRDTHRRGFGNTLNLG